MDISLRQLIGAGLVALFLAGCAGQPDTGRELREGPEPTELLSQAEHQGAPEAAHTRLQAADILARRGNNAYARQIASAIDTAQLNAADRIEWALLLSRIGLEQEDGWSVVQATTILEDDLGMSREDNQTLRYRRGLGLGLIGESLASARTLIALQRETDSLELNDTIWRQLQRLRGKAIDELAADSELAAGWAELAELQWRNTSSTDRLFDRVANWRSSHANHPAAQRMPAELRALRELRGQDVKHMAIFLPKTGPLANIAETIREGMLTRHLNALDQGEHTPRLSFFDSSQEQLDTLYAQATMAGAQVVIGPLNKDKVSQLEQRANVPLPTLALNYGTAPHNRAKDLFQYGLSAEDEARQVAKRAWLDGHRYAGVMVPENAWGSRVSDAFRTAWRELGGRITGLVNYAPEESVASAVRPLLNVREERAQRDMDMLFLLALPSYARQVPPTMDFYYAGDVSIYATSHLYEGRPQPRIDHDLDDVHFIEIPWLIPDAAVGGVAALPFVDSYHKLNEGNNPSLFKLKAMGVDAYELGRQLPMLRAIESSEIYGATGRLTSGPDRRIHRELPWAQFNSGIPQPPLRGDVKAVNLNGIL